MSSHPEVIEAAMLWCRELILQVHMPAHVAFAPLVENFHILNTSIEWRALCL